MNVRAAFIIETNGPTGDLSQSFNAKHCPSRITCITRDRKPLRGFASVVEHTRDIFSIVHFYRATSTWTQNPRSFTELETYVYNRLMMRCSIDKACTDFANRMYYGKTMGLYLFGVTYTLIAMGVMGTHTPRSREAAKRRSGVCSFHNR